MPGDVVLATLAALWRTLKSLGLPAALMGGLAVSVWKHFRATRDVDVLVRIPEEDLPAILEALRNSGYRTKRTPPVLSIGPTRILQLLFEPPGAYIEVQVDFLLAETEYQVRALERRITSSLSDGQVVEVLACEDLILLKLLAGRLIDRADCSSLVHANRGTLDLPYLREQSAQLGLEAELAEVWQDALGEPMRS